MRRSLNWDPRLYLILGSICLVPLAALSIENFAIWDAADFTEKSRPYTIGMRSPALRRVWRVLDIWFTLGWHVKLCQFLGNIFFCKILHFCLTNFQKYGIIEIFGPSAAAGRPLTCKFTCKPLNKIKKVWIIHTFLLFFRLNLF
jgi:hypothetical protein